jgi:hypothetical protein
MPQKKRKHRSEVVLVLYGSGDQALDELIIPYDEFYDASPPVIDSSDYRARLGVLRVTGEIYNSKGELQSHFETFYDNKGKHVRSRAVHQDGTITED